MAIRVQLPWFVTVLVGGWILVLAPHDHLAQAQSAIARPNLSAQCFVVGDRHSFRNGLKILPLNNAFAPLFSMPNRAINRS